MNQHRPLFEILRVGQCEVVSGHRPDGALIQEVA